MRHRHQPGARPRVLQRDGGSYQHRRRDGLVERRCNGYQLHAGGGKHYLGHGHQSRRHGRRERGRASRALRLGRRWRGHNDRRRRDLQHLRPRRRRLPRKRQRRRSEPRSRVLQRHDRPRTGVSRHRDRHVRHLQRRLRPRYGRRHIRDRGNRWRQHADSQRRRPSGEVLLLRTGWLSNHGFRRHVHDYGPRAGKLPGARRGATGRPGGRVLQRYHRLVRGRCRCGCCRPDDDRRRLLAGNGRVYLRQRH